jgi:hypothetical protein
MPSITLASLKASVYSRLENNTRAFKSSQVTTGINEAIKILNVHSGWIQTTIEIGPTVADRCIYDLPEAAVYANNLYLENRYLYKSTVTEIMKSYENILTNTTDLSFTSVEKWAPIGNDKIIIAPASSIAGQSLQVSYLSEPNKLVNDTDVIQIPNEASPVIADYAAHYVQFKLGGTPFNQSMAYFGNFQAFMRQRNNWKALDFPTFKLDRQQN